MIMLYDELFRAVQWFEQILPPVCIFYLNNFIVMPVSIFYSNNFIVTPVSIFYLNNFILTPVSSYPIVQHR